MLDKVDAISKILVTGGAGFIGTATCLRLLDAGHDVTLIDDGSDSRHDRARAELADVNWITSDLLDTDLVELLDRFPYVVHLAGCPGVQSSWDAGFEEHLTVNTLLTQRILEAAIISRPRRIVVASSSSVYGDIPEGSASEDRVLRPLSPYGVSKAAVESLVGVYAARGVEVMALRFFTVYGRRQRPDMALHRIIEAAFGGPSFGMRGSGLQERDFTHIDDAVAAIEASLFASVRSGTICNVGSGRPVSLCSLIDIVEEEVGCPVPFERLDVAEGDPIRTAADISLARQLLAWSPSVTIGAGVTDQIAYQRECIERRHEDCLPPPQHSPSLA